MVSKNLHLCGTHHQVKSNKSRKRNPQKYFKGHTPAASVFTPDQNQYTYQAMSYQVDQGNRPKKPSFKRVNFKCRVCLLYF